MPSKKKCGSTKIIVSRWITKDGPLTFTVLIPLISTFASLSCTNTLFSPYSALLVLEMLLLYFGWQDFALQLLRVFCDRFCECSLLLCPALLRTSLAVVCFQFYAFSVLLPLHITKNSNVFITCSLIILIGDPDYKLKCIGFWKENLRSYLITYDELDAFSRYRCWVYQRADLTKIYMSQALGPYCPLNQDVTSWNYTEGAAVHLNMEEYERERKQF